MEPLTPEMSAACEQLHGCRFTLELDAIKWHLCQERVPFVEASIVGVMLDSMQNKDLSGAPLVHMQPLAVQCA